MDFLILWLGPALAVFAMDLCWDAHARRKPVMAASAAMLWPIYIPVGVWVACNPVKAERIRRRFGLGDPS